MSMETALAVTHTGYPRCAAGARIMLRMSKHVFPLLDFREARKNGALTWPSSLT